MVVVFDGVGGKDGKDKADEETISNFVDAVTELCGENSQNSTTICQFTK